MLILISCPESTRPAEVTDRFVLASTDGPICHLGLRCAAGHLFRMPDDSLSAGARAALRQQEAAVPRGSALR